METVTTSNAPAAIGPYAQATVSAGFLFCSGQLGIDPATGALVADDTAAQAEQLLRNLRAILVAKSLTMADVVKTTIFLVSLADFKTVNEIYARAFNGHKPARSTAQVAALPLGAKIEIEFVAEVKK